MENRQSRRDKDWIKLDNAAKIYPAARRRDWTALFRISAELTEEVDPIVLERAQEHALARFPGFRRRLRRGLFWYYLEENEGAPMIQPDVGNPCVRIAPRENRNFLFRVRYYGKRVALEVYHVLTDGSGGMSFFKTMLAEYLEMKYRIEIPRDEEILDCLKVPDPEELEDAYLRYGRDVGEARKEPDSYYIKGTLEEDFIHITTGFLQAEEALKKAKEKKATLTEYLTAALIMAIVKIQKERTKPGKPLKPVKICVPVNLRNFYPTKTKRNFSYVLNPGIDPQYGEYTFDEVLAAVHHYMGAEATEKMLNVRFSANVNTEKNFILRLLPLFVKNAGMKMVFNLVGDRKTSTCISNLGRTGLPSPMDGYVNRMDLILGPHSRTRVVLGVLSYKGTLTINFTRTIKESVLEREFFCFLVRQGLHVKVESNQSAEEGLDGYIWEKERV